MMKRKTALILSALAGFVFGLVMFFGGFSIGLLVSPPVADIMLFPARALHAVFTDTPFGYLPPVARLALLISNGIFWAVVFAAITAIKRKT